MGSGTLLGYTTLLDCALRHGGIQHPAGEQSQQQCSGHKDEGSVQYKEQYLAPFHWRRISGDGDCSVHGANDKQKGCDANTCIALVSPLLRLWITFVTYQRETI